MLTVINGRNLIGFKKFFAKIRGKSINIIHNKGVTIMDNTVSNIKKLTNSADIRPLLNTKENMLNENSSTWHRQHTCAMWGSQLNMQTDRSCQGH
jgi:hypothetical protein